MQQQQQPQKTALEIFGAPEEVPLWDLQLLFQDGSIYGHRAPLAAGLGTVRTAVEIEEGIRLIDMQGVRGLGREEAAGLLCFLYPEFQVPGARAAGRAAPLHSLERAADYLQATDDVRRLIQDSNKCACCMRGATLPLRSMCESCWMKAGDHRATSPDFSVPEGVMELLGVKAVPQQAVSSLCASIRASPTKTCATFARLLRAHLPGFGGDDRDFTCQGHRLSTGQVEAIQAALGNAWCRWTEVSLHNLMALPGQYKPREGCEAIHCYLGFQDDKRASARSNLQHSTGRVVFHGGGVDQSGGAVDPSMIVGRCRCSP
jgi:hypothetical protein